MIGRAPIFEERLLPLLRLAAEPEGVAPCDMGELADADVLVDLGAAQWKRRIRAGKTEPEVTLVLHATVPGLTSLLDAQLREAASIANLAANDVAVSGSPYFQRLLRVLRRRPA